MGRQMAWAGRLTATSPVALGDDDILSIFVRAQFSAGGKLDFGRTTVILRP